MECTWGSLSTELVSRTTRDELIFMMDGNEIFCLCSRRVYISSWTIRFFVPELNYVWAYVRKTFTLHTNKQGSADCPNSRSKFDLDFISYKQNGSTLWRTKSIHIYYEGSERFEYKNLKYFKCTFEANPRIVGTKIASKRWNELNRWIEKLF